MRGSRKKKKKATEEEDRFADNECSKEPNYRLAAASEMKLIRRSDANANKDIIDSSKMRPKRHHLIER
jgi:hypothetical protein